VDNCPTAYGAANREDGMRQSPFQLIITACLFMIPIHGVLAQELRLICDPLDERSKPLILVIDANKLIITEYGDGYKSTYTEGKTEENKNNGTAVQCVRNTTEFVKISESEIKFGNSTTANLNQCGDDLNHLQAPGTSPADSYVATIDRSTGILSNTANHQWQCQKITGNAF
jgi:hypothetical protein